MTKATRTEKDSLGNVDVPKDALYGAQTMRAIQNFPVSGRTAHPSLIRGYLLLKKAAALANSRESALKADCADLITRAVDQILNTKETEWPWYFPVDPYQAGAGTSQNMNTNEVIANVANQLAGKELGSYNPVHPNDHVNRSQSTNDSFPTAMRIALLLESSSLLQELSLLGVTFQEKAQQWREIPKSARTHLQDAVPITLGQEFEAYAITLQNLHTWISHARDELKPLGIGGSAAGTGLTVPEGYSKRVVKELTNLLGEEVRCAENLVESMQSQMPIHHYSSSLRTFATQMTRICNDLRLMSSGPLTGLAELQLPPVQPGSSIMPGKVNPSILEMANQAWFSVMGYDHTVTQCVQAGQLNLNVMMPMMAYSAIEATRVSSNTLKILRKKCIEGIEPNTSRLREYFEKTPQVATALSPKLGYDKTAELVKEALATHRSVIELVRERKLMKEEELNALLDVKRLTGQK